MLRRFKIIIAKWIFKALVPKGMTVLVFDYVMDETQTNDMFYFAGVLKESDKIKIPERYIN
jgi:hypothetical protein